MRTRGLVRPRLGACDRGEDVDALELAALEQALAQAVELRPMLSEQGNGVGVGVRTGVAVGVGTGVEVGDGVAVGVGTGVAVAVGAGVTVGVGPGVTVGVGVVGVAAGDAPPSAAGLSDTFFLHSGTTASPAATTITKNNIASDRTKWRTRPPTLLTTSSAVS